ncbi:hypothetical protein NPIL_171371, partial [Nephila pilipes]
YWCPSWERHCFCGQSGKLFQRMKQIKHKLQRN